MYSSAWRYRVNAGTGWFGVSKLLLGEIASLVCSLCPNVAARPIVGEDTAACCSEVLSRQQKTLRALHGMYGRHHICFFVIVVVAVVVLDFVSFVVWSCLQTVAQLCDETPVFDPFSAQLLLVCFAVVAVFAFCFFAWGPTSSQIIRICRRN